MSGPSTIKGLFVAGMLACAVLKPSGHLHAQYLPVWNSWQDHGLSYNPAYAGSHDAVSLSAFYRMQWADLPSGPQTISLAIHSPLRNQNLALGAELFSDEIGPLRRHALQSHFAWRRPAGKGYWSLGLNGGAHLEEAAFANLDAALEGDPAFMPGLEDRWGWNAGSGAMYYNHWFMASGSAMDLANDPQFFAASNALIRIAQSFGIRPGAMLRYPQSGEYQYDANVHLLFADAFWLGGGYRSNGDLLFQALWQQRFPTALGFAEYCIGYSFQYPDAKLRSSLGPSHEILLSYRFNRDKTREFGPRFF